MKRVLALICTLTWAMGLLRAQEVHVDSVWMDTRNTFHQQVCQGVYDSHFQGDYHNFHLSGHLTDKLTYRVRHRLNKKIEDGNPFSATDFLWLKWQASSKWAFTAGKHSIMIGGYEIDSAPIDVYYYGAFSNNLAQFYAFGAAATYTPVPGQDIWFQFCPSPVTPGTQDAYSFNIYWGGHIGKDIQTTWSVNFVEDKYHRIMNWIVLGNKFFFGDLVVDVDFINRASVNQPQFLGTDWTVIGKAIWSVGKWNFCTKAGYETNSAANVDADGLSYDLVLPAGNKYLYYGAGIEYFPLRSERVRLHAAWFRDNHDNINNFDMGITWRVSIYKRRK